MKMRLYIWFTLVVVTFIAIQSTVDGGLIRRSRRLRRIGPLGSRPGTRSARVLHRRKWPHFLAPPRKWQWGRNLQRVKHQNTEREDRPSNRPGHQLRLPLMMTQGGGPMMQTSASTTLSSWRPLDFGNPKSNFDPIFDYAPPALERVRFADGNRRPPHPPPSHHRKPPTMGMRSENNGGKPRPLFNRPRRPSIWKLLATKQRPRRPFNRRPPPPPHMRYPHDSNEEAEIFPRMPNIVYFRPADVMPSTKPFNNINPTSRPHQPFGSGSPPPPTYRPGKVTSVPLYSREINSPSQFNPIPQQSIKSNSVVSSPHHNPHHHHHHHHSIPKKPDDILYRAQEFMNPTRKPTVLQPVRSTPLTLAATRNSAIKPIEPTESIIDIIKNPPKPVNSFSIFHSPNSVFASTNIKDSHHDNNLVIDGGNDHRDDDDDDDDIDVDVESKKVFSKLIEKPSRPSPVFEPASVSVSPASDNNDDEESTTSVAISTSVSTSTSVLVRAGDVSTSTSTTETSMSTSPSAATAATPTESPQEIKQKLQLQQYQKLPEMPTYKKRPTPIYPKRITSIKSAYGSSSIGGGSRGGSSSNGGSSSSKENGSGEGLVITMARSKVKEYKPQFLANYTQLLTFDKVAEVEPSDNLDGGPITSSSSPSSAVVTSSPATGVSFSSSSSVSSSSSSASASDSPNTNTETTTRKSPLEQFDPMQLLHSWFQNT